MELSWDKICQRLTKIHDSRMNSAILDKIEYRETRNNDTIVLVAPDPMVAGWFRDNFLEDAKKIAENIAKKPFDFEIAVADNKTNFDNVKSKTQRHKKQTEKRSVLNLNSKYIFDRFIVGPNNDFAHAAAMNVARNPGKSYNPLFVYGNVALGKTHLLQAIAHRIVEEKPEMKILYITSEQFTNDFVQMIRDKDRKKFDKKFRDIDVLIIDDIQFFQDKEKTLGELFSLFNILAHRNKQMVFACDRPPNSLTAVEDRLRTRFDSGLTVEIKAPAYETRKAILLERAELENADIPNSVVDYIAKNIENDIRRLESSLIKLIAFSELKHQNISMNLAKEILRDKIKVEMPKDISITQIQKVVSKYFGISKNDLVSNKRLESIAYPRQVAMYLAKKYTSLSLTEIGNLFGGKAHTTVMRSSEKIAKMVKRRKTKNELNDIIATFYETAR